MQPLLEALKHFAASVSDALSFIVERAKENLNDPLLKSIVKVIIQIVTGGSNPSGGSTKPTDTQSRFLRARFMVLGIVIGFILTAVALAPLLRKEEAAGPKEIADRHPDAAQTTSSQMPADTATQSNSDSTAPPPPRISSDTTTPSDSSSAAAAPNPDRKQQRNSRHRTVHHDSEVAASRMQNSDALTVLYHTN